MSKLEELKAAKTAAINSARAIAAKAEEENRDFSDEERGQVTAFVEKAREADRELKALEGFAGVQAELSALSADLVAGAGVAPGKGGTLGERLVGSDRWQSWYGETFSGGQPMKGARIHSPAVEFGGMKDLLGPVRGAKTVVTGAGATSGGALVTNDYAGLLDPTGTFMRPLTIRDLVTSGGTTSDTVEYSRVTGFTNNAAPVPEATSAGVTTEYGGEVTTTAGGRKPESAMTLERVSTPVKTVAHWIPATKRALSDAAQIRTLIDNFMRYGLEEELEDQIISGDDTGENFEGILEVSGLSSQAWDSNLLVTTRKAKTLVRTQGRATATAYVLNPEDNERIDLLRDGSGGSDDSGAFMFGSPTGTQQQTLWGLPRIESEAVPAGTGIVADWRQAVLWDREQAGIQVTDSHADFFVRNLVAILAEMRAAFGVIRPAAFVTIDLTSGS